MFGIGFRWLAGALLPAIAFLTLALSLDWNFIHTCLSIFFGCYVGGFTFKLISDIKLWRVLRALPIEATPNIPNNPLRHLQESLAELNGKMAQVETEANTLLERYQLLTDNLAASVVIRDQSGKISYCSPYTEVLTGYALASIYGYEEDFFLKIAHDEDKEKLARALKYISVGEAFGFRYRFYHKTGLEMWGETRIVPVLDQHGAVRSSLSITLDVTGSVRYQTQVEEKNKDLNDFTYMVSHDLKAPIFTIKGMLGIMEEDLKTDAPEEIKEPLSHILKATDRLESLVSSVLEYSKISLETIPPQKVDLKEVLQEVLADYSDRTKKSGVQIKIAEDLPLVLGEKLKLYQVFSNLIGNAIKFKSTNKIPIIRVAPGDSQNPRYLTLTVEDNGLGIPKEKHPLLFRPFQRLHGQNIEGSGIGLVCVKKLLEKLGGNISFKSEAGEGTTFYVTLKRHQETDNT